jgi:hypothetical protein
MKNLAHNKYNSSSNFSIITFLLKVGKHFVPCHTTRKRATFLKHNFFIIYALFFLILQFSINLSQKLIPGVLGYSSEIKINELYEKTNEYRKRNNLPPLILNEKLSKAATEKGKYMFEKNFWAHTAPDGTEPWVFVLNQGYDYSFAGENLARNYYNAGDVVNAWIASPTHRENLISKNYDEVGYAVVNGILDGKETSIVVQFFGRPADPSFLTSKEQEKELLSSLGESTSQVNAFGEEVKSASIDIPSVFRYLAFSVLGFVLALFLVDIYYSKRKDIDKFTGHTEAHLMILVATVVSLLIILRNGQVL